MRKRVSIGERFDSPQLPLTLPETVRTSEQIEAEQAVPAIDSGKTESLHTPQKQSVKRRKRKNELDLGGLPRQKTTWYLIRDLILGMEMLIIGIELKGEKVWKYDLQDKAVRLLLSKYRDEMNNGADHCKRIVGTT